MHNFVQKISRQKTVFVFLYYFLLFFVAGAVLPLLEKFITYAGNDYAYTTVDEFWISFSFNTSAVFIAALYLSVFNTISTRQDIVRGLLFFLISILILYGLTFLLAYTVSGYFGLYTLFLYALGYWAIISIPVGIIGKYILTLQSKTTKAIVAVLPFVFVAIAFSIVMVPSTSAECANISNEHKKNVCLTKASQKGEAGGEVCSLIPDAVARDECLFRFVNYNSDEATVEICRSIRKNHRYQTSCYLIVANRLDRHEPCLEIPDITLRDECIFDFSRYNTISNVGCNSIQDIGKRDRCLSENEKRVQRDASR